MMRALFAGILMLLLAAFSPADTYLRQPSIDVVRYEISIELSDKSDSIVGTTKVHVMMRDDNVARMWLDFTGMKVDRLLVGGVERPFTYRDGRISFPFDRQYSRREIAVVEVRYSGKPENGGLLIGENRYGHRVFFADNWPDRAHHWFPSVDHPSDKAAVDFAVAAPEKYDVVANGRLIETRSLLNGRKLTRWSESKAIPTYSMVIGVAEFSISHQASEAGIPLVWYSYPQDSEPAAQKFRRTSIALRYFSSLIGSYPYEKLAQVQSTARMGGMENSSAIFYGESSFQEAPVPEEPVPHEIAHQWFGDSITQADWDHLWLSEGFATYFEAMFQEHLQGPEALKRFMARSAEKVKEYKSAYSAPVIDPNLTDPMKKLNPLSYHKGAWVLHMLRGILGEAAFREGIRRYYSLYEGGNTLTEDFQKAMESASGITLSAFFQQWLYQPGLPDYQVAWHWNEAIREAEITIRQTQTTGLFDMPLDLAISIGSQREMHRFRVSEAAQMFRLPLQAKPSSVELDPENWVLKSASVLER